MLNACKFIPPAAIFIFFDNFYGSMFPGKFFFGLPDFPIRAGTATLEEAISMKIIRIKNGIVAYTLHASPVY